MSDCLLVDAGNSRLKWAISRHGILSECRAFNHSGDEIQKLFSQWSELHYVPSRVLLASVADESLGLSLMGWIKEAWQLPVEIATVEAVAFGVKNCYARVDRLGVDRWAAMIAARQLQSGAVCVIDCGTATTIDAIDARGQHLGGLIMPGLDLMRVSLINNTAGIGAYGVSDRESMLACDTLSAVNGGSLQATLGFIERTQREIHKIIKTSFATVLCGGGATDLLPLLSGDVRHEPDLVLKGLNIIAMTKV